MADSVFGSSTIPMSLPAKTSPPPPSSTSSSGGDKNKIAIPELNIEPWIERCIQIFTAIAAQFLIQRLQATSTDASIVVLLVLILAMFFFIELEHRVRKLSSKWIENAKEFRQVMVAVMKVLEFTAMTSVFVASSYIIVLLMTLWVYGNLSFAETASLIIGGVLLVYQFAVSAHFVKSSLEEAANRERKKTEEKRN
jgi:hypothetical protein